VIFLEKIFLLPICKKDCSENPFVFFFKKQKIATESLVRFFALAQKKKTLKITL
jgi:hypothetical protein